MQRHPSQSIAKRGFDLALALALAIPAIAISVLAMFFIWVDDRANPIFVQKRLGRNGAPFHLVKLRTMRVGTGDRPSHESQTTNITRIGALLRRTKLDELPQLWNVLRGEMSFVGPRPGLPSQTILAEARRRHGVDRLLPGITGVAQVAGVDMSTPEYLAEVDAGYLGKWSLGRDLALLLRTASGSGRGDAIGR
ncbi:sugar transferase [Sphingomonas sp. Leaf23]|uniref:sugar transferase n=1 Tax=Sphingomonas sp. Leaf23 TaxID=1735689 RepID=UPI0009EA808A|nr:sugar transferase [Sphingomonas sp. Leaf23]